MPRLLRLRLVCVGHPLARANDLLLDFRDPVGRAADSTLWLRNGGGKSSILNLFFALLRPNRGEFLGGKAEAKQRSLEDYVLPGDRSVVAAEWELDAAAGDLELEVQRFLTGVFCERREGSGELRRLFFATRSVADDPDSTLDGLPLFTSVGEVSARRRTLSSFREAWRSLRDRVPQLGTVDTESQREWQDILEAASIDPDLFSYQVRMNLREGGADEIFRFNEPEDFVDFLLELALDPALADRVANNIATYRRELVLRRDKLLPERGLVTGLRERLGELQQVAVDRNTQRERLREAALELELLGRWARQQFEAAEAAAVRANDARTHAVAQAESHERAAADLRLRACTLSERAAASRLARLEADHRVAEERWQAAQRESKIWAAAVPRHREQQLRERARECRRQLERQQAEHAPLRQRLGEAATKFAGALTFRATELRGVAGEHHAAAAAARSEAREALDSAAASDKRQGTALEQGRQLRMRLAEVAEVRRRLEARGALRAGEVGEAGLARLETARTEHQTALERIAGELSAADERFEALSASLATLGQLMAEQESVTRSLEARWNEASLERHGLEADPVLKLALELEELDLDRLGDDALGTLEARARQEQERAVQERLGHATDERASLHIEEHGLLPPSPDVQRLLGALRTRLGAAWSGWEWVAENAPNGQARDQVRRVPHAAQGIVVRPDDLTAAIALLREHHSEPDTPVVITTPEAFQARPDLPGEVLGPAEPAWYDRDAAQHRLGEMRARLEAHRQRIEEAERHQRELNERRASLRAFRARYPRGWFAEASTRLDAASRQIADTRGRIAETEVQRAALRRRREQIASDQVLAGQRLAETTRWLDQVRGFVEEHERPSETWRVQLDAAERAAEEATREARTWRDMADASEHRAGEREAKAQALGEDARELERELREVAFLDSPPTAAPGTLDLLRDRYRQLRAEYDEKVGADALRLMAERHEEDANAARQLFRKLLGADCTERDVDGALASLAEPDRVEEERTERERLAGSLQGRVGNLAGRIEGAKQKLEEAQRRRTQLGPPATLQKVPSEPELIEAEAARADAGAGEQEEAAVRARATAAMEATALQAAESRVATLESARERVAGLRENFADLLEQAHRPTEVPEAALALEADAVLHNRAGAVEQSLRDVRRRWQELDARRHAAAHEVRGFLARPEHEGLDTPWVSHVTGRDDGALEDSAERLAEQLHLRTAHLEAQIGEAERHRTILVDEVLAVAEEGLKLLRVAGNVSRLPDHVPGLGGTHFLRITAEPPEDPQERRGRVGELVDQVAAVERPTGGIALVQAAVRRLARPVQVRVLHPDPALERRSVSIPEMARFSGGEQLTGAILLYCTLARLRARSRGLSRHPSSVLVLDNPVGRVSRPRFLEIQREVARAMGVQLIYATGVNDYEALRVLPNVIRLRNERIDRNRGHRLVEPEEAGANIVEAVRVAREERVARGERPAGDERAAKDEQAAKDDRAATPAATRSSPTDGSPEIQRAREAEA